MDAVEKESYFQLHRIFEAHHSGKTGFSLHYLTLYSLALGLEARRVFEFGCGLSSLTLLAALEKTGGDLITCDVRHFSECGLERSFEEPRWDFRQGLSKEILASLGDEVFELVLHDGSHTPDVVHEDLLQILPRVKKNGIVLIHDTEHPSKDYGLEAVVPSVFSEIRADLTTLPYGYGLTIARIREDFGHGEVDLQWRKGVTV